MTKTGMYETRNIIEIRNLSFSYEDGTPALQQLDFNLQEGKITALLGANGAGKSSLMMVLNGLLKPQQGQYTIGLELNQKRQKATSEYNSDTLQTLVTYERHQLRALRQKVGVVFQDPDTQLFSESVTSEIRFGLLNLKKSSEEMAEALDWVMTELDLKSLKDKPTHCLSYGQKKRVCIADILVMKPEVIILDEPTAGLDPLHLEEMLKLLEYLKRQGLSVLVSTHDVDSVWQFADQVVVLKEGKVIIEGKPEEVFAKEDVLKQCGLRMPYIMQLLLHMKKPWQEIWTSRPKSIQAIMEEM